MDIDAFPGSPGHVLRAIAAAGFDTANVVEDSVTLHVEAVTYESLHAHGFFQPGTVYTNTAKSRLTFDVVTDQGLVSHEIPYDTSA